MKVTAFELTGARLDYWVARADGLIDKIDGIYMMNLQGGGFGPVWIQSEKPYSPSSNGSDGVPIIEREGIGTAKYHEAIDGPMDATGLQWAAMSVDDTVFARGATMLEAAMRVFVASKLGETFDDGVAA